MPRPDRDAHLQAVVDRIEAHIAGLPAISNLPVGAAEVPSAHAGRYIVVYPTPGGGRGGSLSAPQDDATWIYQTSCVGNSARQAAAIADLVEDALLGATVTVNGRDLHVYLDLEGGIRPDTDRGEAAETFTATPRWGLMTTPAPV